MKKATSTSVVRMVYSAMFLALAILLPFLLGQLPQAGRMFAPMHIPVLLCGFICGKGWGFAVGICAPVLRSSLFMYPAMMPDAVAMALELATYGFVVGALYRALPKKTIYHYLALITAMLAGRVAWGAVRFLLAGIQNTEFSFSIFLSKAFATALPGIVIQIVFIPPIIYALRRNRMILNF